MKIHKESAAFILGLGLLIVCSYLATAKENQTLTEYQIYEVARLTNPEGVEIDAWFEKMAISGDTMVVGAPGDDHSGVGDAGSAHIFTRESGVWAFQQSLTAPDAEEYDQFGAAVTVSGDTVAVGALWEDPGGSVYVYIRSGNTWEFQQKVIPTDGREDGRFGVSVALSEDTLVVGSTEGPPQYAGNFRVFTRSEGEWTEQQKVVADDADDHEWAYFGTPVAFSGITIVAGARGNEEGGQENCGAAYVFERADDSWVFQQKLAASDAAVGDSFGTPLAISGDTILVGSPGNDHSGFDDAGAAYVFSRAGDEWIEQQKLMASTPVAGDFFGAQVAISGDVTTVGGTGWWRTADPWTAAVEFYSRRDADFEMEKKITGADLGCPSLGLGIAIDGTTAAASSHYASIDTYAVHVFNVVPDVSRISIPAVARIQGIGAYFTSRWNLFNASDDDIRVELLYTPRVDFGGSQRTVEYNLQANEVLEIEDPLLEIFNITEDAVGSVMITVLDGSREDVMVQSVVFARLADGAEFGQFFPALDDGDAVVPGQVGCLTTTENPALFRVNVGLMALEDGTRVRLTPVDPTYHSLSSSITVHLDRAQSRQLNDVHGLFGLELTPDVMIDIQVEEGRALAYGSVLDGKGAYTGTSDPTTVRPMVRGAPSVTLLELGPVQGYDEFSGSASITNMCPYDDTFHAAFYARGTPGVAATAVLNIQPWETVGFSDFVGDVFGLSDAVGTVVVTPEEWGVIDATGREFALIKDGDGNVTGTAGQLIEGLSPNDLLDPSTTHHFIGLRQQETADGLERSHIAFFNPGEDRVEVTIKLYDDAGALEGEWTRNVRPMELVHVNNIITTISSAQDGGVKRLEVSVTAPVHARVFRVNTTGDPITIEPFRR